MTRIRIIAFTADGAALARQLAIALDATAWAPAKYACTGVEPLPGTSFQWTAAHFGDSDALIFISACGIAVRAIAPHLRSKATDPAVICLDDHGQNVISLVSGHLGGANALALRVAEITGGHPVITTATDVHGVQAVDVWAKDHNCAIENLGTVKDISSAVLDRQPVGVAVTEQLMPAPWPVTLWLRPKNLVLGAGCKRGMPVEKLRPALADFLDGAGVARRSIAALASIDLKANEPGLNALAGELGAPFITYSAEELRAAQGHFSHSEKVLSVTGVDNVCERAAVLATCGGPLIRSKTIYPGITFALARLRPGERPPELNRTENKGDQQ